jgi:hypothetical protein
MPTLFHRATWFQQADEVLNVTKRLPQSQADGTFVATNSATGRIDLFRLSTQIPTSIARCSAIPAGRTSLGRALCIATAIKAQPSRPPPFTSGLIIPNHQRAAPFAKRFRHSRTCPAGAAAFRGIVGQFPVFVSFAGTHRYLSIRKKDALWMWHPLAPQPPLMVHHARCELTALQEPD